MSQVLKEAVGVNDRYAASFGEEERAHAAARAAVRDPHVHGRPPRPGQVRRAHRGRRPRDPQRRRPGERRRDPSLVISYKLLGTREWFVIHHTDCGMEFFTERGDARPLGRASRRPSSGPKASRTSAPAPGRPRAKYIDWLTIDDTEQSVVDDVARIRATRSCRRASRCTATSTT